eukprot:TRINITY_DN13883_c0_g2_i3.p1 TRINITY_DN13883_c0_g2~~TRINITY_DN13883_c0_g2_i3.p1  ORF type:complete len:150 (-),score=18.14 TRINITY_DN13883_c0_g2_i3:298-747(-)
MDEYIPIITLHSDFGYVILTVVFAVVAHQWMALFKVMEARKEYNVPYPTMYADKHENKYADKFNCIQRGHQNSLESLPQFFVLLILAGLQFPYVSALVGTIFVIGRILYFIGYSSGNPAGRLAGAPFYAFPFMALLSMCIYIATKVLQS